MLKKRLQIVCEDTNEGSEIFKTSHASNSNIMNQTRLYGQTLIKGDFNIFYEIKSENIEIITIWDCRQEPNKLKIKD